MHSLKPLPVERARTIAAALAGCAVAIAGCTKESSQAGPAPTNEAAGQPAAWPQGHSPPLKVTDKLILEIPLEYERSAIYHGQAARALISVQSDRSEVQFEFFLPDFTGYTLENYRNESDPNKVEVVYLHAGDPHERELDAPGEYPPNMLKRALRDLLNPADYRDMYGLRCYRDRAPSDRMTCYGRRDAASREDIMLSALVPPYGGNPFPTVQARYFSKRYDGVRIAWRAHVKNLPRWHEIDSQIWKFIEAWNMAQAPERPRAARAAPAPQAGHR